MSCGQNKKVAKNFLSFLCFSLLSSLKWEHRALGPMSRGTNDPQIAGTLSRGTNDPRIVGLKSRGTNEPWDQ